MREIALQRTRTTVHIESDQICTLEEDLHIWKMICNIIIKLGAAGMSSEDTSFEDRETVYRVKVMIWRWRMEKILQLVDRQRVEDPTLYMQRGSKGVKRVRIAQGTLESNWQWKSRWIHPENLPEVLYDPDWLQNILGNRAVVSFQVSREDFKFFDFESIRGDFGEPGS